MTESSQEHPVRPVGGAEDESATALVAAQFESHSGPLPSKEWLNAAERHFPGATKILVEDFAAQRDHQRSLAREALSVDREALRRFSRFQSCQLFVIGLAIIIIAGGGVAAVLDDKQLAGLAVLIPTLTALILAIQGRSGRESTAPRGDSDEEGVDAQEQ